jgi:hypothetical protein
MPEAKPIPCLGWLEAERKMTKKLSSVLQRIAKALRRYTHGANLPRRHGELAQQLALVAPLGGGAIVAWHALHLPDSE